MMVAELFTPFLDPVLRGPTIGCMLMCFAAALVGVFSLLRRQALIGEALSHAAYPGVIASAVAAAWLGFEADETVLALAIALGGGASALMGLWCIQLLERKLAVSSDAALCFILAIFFGFGITLASNAQFSYPLIYRSVQAYLYGQAATMTDSHIMLYGILAFVVAAVIALFFKELQLVTFDRAFAMTLGLPCRTIDTIFFLLLVASIVIGIRAVGVVLMSAMLIAPAVTARQFCKNLRSMLLLAGASGAFSGYLGNYLSSAISEILATAYPSQRLSMPTGPAIVVVAAALALFSLLFAPERGALIRLIRAILFRYRCLCENILKGIWKKENKKETLPHYTDEFSFKVLKSEHLCSAFSLYLALLQLVYNGWLQRAPGGFHLTAGGKIKAARIIRVHRLWEVYLADYLGVGAERVHLSAEEMEHVLTPELEKELTLLLDNPHHDPHHQLIPPHTIL